MKNNDKPWITDYFKQLVERRDEADKSGSVIVYKRLRNQVNRVRNSLKTNYYFDQVHCLKSEHSRNWWQHIKTLAGALDSGSTSDCFVNLTCDGQNIHSDVLPEVLNNFFVSVTADVLPLDLAELDNLRARLCDIPDCFIVSEYSVFNALRHLKVNKSSCDDVLSNKLLVQLADVLAAPICALINTSIRQGIVPNQWKTARITPIPKINPPVLIESDLRPISITSGISKIAESFVCKLFDRHFNNFVDPNQFGCTSKRSTAHALIKISALLFESSDDSSNIIRILFIDFCKAFDLVDHNVLLRKFVAYDFPPHVIAWSMSFCKNELSSSV